MMAYNNDKFLEAALDPLLASEHVERIVVVEGAWSPHAESKRSVDNTIDILKRLQSDPKIEVLYWDQIPVEAYRWYQCDWHRALMKGALNHPYYDGEALQQQLLARDWGLRHILSHYVGFNAPSYPPTGVLSYQDPGWLWIVDSDEVYDPEKINDLVEFLNAVGEDFDYFTIQGKNFYFSGKYYHNEWYRRLFRLQPHCFFSDDNSLEIPGAAYTRTMNMPEDIIEFFHYGYVGEFRVRKKLEMWRQDAVQSWWDKHGNKMKGEEYNAEPVHLFGDLNPGYRDYRLEEFKGKHPALVGKECEDCDGDGRCEYCKNAGSRCGCGGACQACNGAGVIVT